LCQSPWAPLSPHNNLEPAGKAMPEKHIRKFGQARPSSICLTQTKHVHHYLESIAKQSGSYPLYWHLYEIEISSVMKLP
jgi:hypothetical protein